MANADPMRRRAVVRTLAGELLSASAGLPARAQAQAIPQPWPPVAGQRYPDLALTNSRSERLRLSSLGGRVLLIKPIGMNCPTCNAFSGAGGGRLPGFRGTQPQRGLRSIEESMPLFSGGIRLDDPRLDSISLLLDHMEMRSPTLADARAWEDHFGHGSRPNRIVAIADPRYINQASYNMIPGLQRVDRDLVLRSDATGHHPRHDLWRHTLPMVGTLLRGAPHA